LKVLGETLKADVVFVVLDIGLLGLQDWTLPPTMAESHIWSVLM
jgi:hypothetical protein